MKKPKCTDCECKGTGKYKCDSCNGQGFKYCYCPDCQPPDFPKLTKQQKKDQTEFIKTASEAKIFEPEAQTEQKECECHCHHHGNCVEDAACIAMYCEHCHPQPTDGQKIYFSGDDLHWKSQKENCKEGNHTFTCKCECGEELDIEELIRADRAEQKQKTREDTIEEIEAGIGNLGYTLF